jgi:CheY-like chemotaxis protein
MCQPSPLRGLSVLDHKRVLLIDPNQPTCDVRASVLRAHGIQVDAANSLQAARSVWQPNLYDLILLDMRRQFPGEALAFYEQIRDKSPRQHFAFLVGPPQYLSVTWPENMMVTEIEPQQWAATMKHFLAAA